MKVSKMFYIFVFFASAIVLSYSSACADQFKIAIMQDERGAAAKYRQLETYLKDKGIEFSFVGATNYPAAAKMEHQERWMQCSAVQELQVFLS